LSFFSYPDLLVFDLEFGLTHFAPNGAGCLSMLLSCSRCRHFKGSGAKSPGFEANAALKGRSSTIALFHALGFAQEILVREKAQGPSPAVAGFQLVGAQGPSPLFTRFCPFTRKNGAQMGARKRVS
jgi:hypothetical protein